MFAVTSPSLCWTLLSVSLVGFTCAGHKIITAESEQDVPLTCRAPNNNIIVVNWSRADLEPEYVLLYRDEQFLPDNQHPSFKNRVDLQDRQMKDGDVSLILKDVTTADSGKYECRVVMRGTRLWKPISIISLSVDPPAPPGGDTEDGEVKDGVARGHYGALVASVLLLVLIVVVLVVLIFKKYKKDETSSMTVE